MKSLGGTKRTHKTHPPAAGPFVDSELNVFVPELRHPFEILLPCLDCAFNTVRQPANLVYQRVISTNELLLVHIERTVGHRIQVLGKVLEIIG